MRKKKIIFVGSFKPTSEDGSVGGQMFACKTIVNSAISDSVDWTLIDTTAVSNLLLSTYARAKKALLRVLKFTYYILFFKHDFVLIFVADGWSFWEKGLMAILAKYFTSSKVILAPRSGLIINDIKNNNNLTKFIKFVFKKTDFVICQSNLWKQLFEKTANQFNNSKYVVVENMIDFNKYAELPLGEVKENEKVTILFMAWVTRNKGIYELIEVVKMLKKDKLNFKVIIAGKGDEFEKINKEIKATNLTEFIELKGWVLGDQKLEILMESDIFVLPTYFEGYPNSLIEAMASGKACVATRVGSIPDIISDMETGILIEKQNVKQLYLGIKTLIQNGTLRNEMGIKARKHVSKTNSAIYFVTKLKEILGIDVVLN